MVHTDSPRPTKLEPMGSGEGGGFRDSEQILLCVSFKNASSAGSHLRDNRKKPRVPRGSLRGRCGIRRASHMFVLSMV